MHSGFLEYPKGSIHFRYSGNGSHLLFCLHGYAESSEAFSFLQNIEALQQYTVIAIDLPWHGKTAWKEALHPEELVAIMNDVAIKVMEDSPQQVTLLGFSLGGRMALSLYEHLSVKPEKMVLLAPDGLKMNFWYWIATQTLIGKKIFHFTMKHPGWLFGMMKFINKLGLLNASVFKFVHYYIDNAHLREILYHRWISLRKIKPDLQNLKKQIRQHNTQVRLVYGLHDRIILSAPGRRFRNGIEEYCTINSIASGHQVLHRQHQDEIMKALIH